MPDFNAALLIQEDNKVLYLCSCITTITKNKQSCNKNFNRMKKPILTFIIIVFLGWSINAQVNKHDAFALWKNVYKHNQLSPDRSINSMVHYPGKETDSYWDTISNVWNYIDSIRNIYNNTGDIILKMDYSGGPTHPNKTISVYDGNRNKTSDTSLYWNAGSYSMDGLNTYTYDIHGNQTERVQYSGWNGSVWGSGDKDDFLFDVNNNQIQNLHTAWDGAAWVNSSKSDNTWNGVEMTQEIDQYWNGAVWVNSFKADYTYVGGQLNSFIGYTWNGTSWQNSGHTISIVWYQWNGTYGNSKISSYTEQVPNGSLWKDSIKYYFTYDIHGNQTDYLVQSKPAATYITTDEAKHIFIYDGFNSITEDVYQNWNPVTALTRNYIKRNFSDFRSFEVLSVINRNSNEAAFVVFPNPNDGRFQVQNSTYDVNGADPFKIAGMVIYNLMGEKIYTSVYSPLSNWKGAEVIDLSAQPKGVYFLQVIDENKNVLNRKIIKQ